MEIKRPFSVSFRDERRHATSNILRADNVIEGDLTLGGRFLATEGDADIQMLVHMFLLCLNTLFSYWCYYRNKTYAKKDFMSGKPGWAVSIRERHGSQYLRYSALRTPQGWWAEFSSPRKPTEIA